MYDRELEDAIDAAGRPHVFAAARLNGWEPGSAPPKWVWWALVREVTGSNEPKIGGKA